MRMELADLLRRQFDQRLAAHALSRGEAVSELNPLPPQAVFPVGWPQNDVDKHVVRLLATTSGQNHQEVVETQIQLTEDRIAELEALREKLPEDVRWAAGLVSFEEKIVRAAARVSELRSMNDRREIRAGHHGRLQKIHFH